MIDLFRVYMSKKVDQPLLDVIHSGWIGQCKKNKEFEKALAERFNNPYAITLSSCTHALHLAYRLSGIWQGDEVITTPLTCFCANTPILYQGADIVWADVKRDDMNIDPESIEKCITSKTRAIYAVHWGGYPCDLEKIHKIAKENNLVLIEDAAHAFGSTYKGSTIGDCTYSDFVCFSFQAIKQLTTGDGGVLFTKSAKNYQKGKLLRWYGIDREGGLSTVRCEDDIKEWGYKYHMNDIASIIGLVNMREVDYINSLARDNVDYYRRELKDVSGITLIQNKKDRTSANWLFTILVDRKKDFCKMMTEKGIATSHVHARNDDNSCVMKFRKRLPNLEWLLRRYICIPCGWWLTEHDRSYIVESIKGGW